jgi:hypothetical protein
MTSINVRFRAHYPRNVEELESGAGSTCLREVIKEITERFHGADLSIDISHFAGSDQHHSELCIQRRREELAAAEQKENPPRYKSRSKRLFSELDSEEDVGKSRLFG